MRHVLRPTGRRARLGGTARRGGAAVGAFVVLGAALAFVGAPSRANRLETITTAMAASTTQADTVSAARRAPVSSTTALPLPMQAPTTLVPAAETVEPPPPEMAPRPTEAPPTSAARRTPAAVTNSGRAPATAAASTPASAGGADTAAPPTDNGTPVPEAVTNCLLWLHGKGGYGAATTSNGGIVRVAPMGNAAGWGGRQWMYFPESGYQAALGSVTAAVDEAGCTRVIVGGFSNGGAFAAKLYCRGESFGGRLVRVVVDDPVVDHAVNGCSPAPGVGVTLYWTGALEGTAQPGWACAGSDWTCEGGSTIGIDAYAAALGTPAKRSPMGGHSPYTAAPELSRF